MANKRGNYDKNPKGSKSAKGSNFSGKRNKGKDYSHKESEMEGSRNNKFRKEDNRGNTTGSNSPEWYGGSGLLMRNAANISFHTGAGRPVSFHRDDGSVYEYNPAGIMVFNTLNCPGAASDWNSPVNLAARHLYTFVRHVNSGHSNYDAVDLMMYITLMDNAFSYYAWMVRVYGTMRTVLLRNKFTPVGLVKAMGCNYDQLASCMADLRYYINLYATRLNQMAVPADIPLFQRHMWMYSNIYADAPTEKAQFYIFKPYAFWRYVVSATERYVEPSIPVPSAGDEYLFQLNHITTYGDIILNQLLQREDFNIMSGDIMKAYGDKLFKLNVIDEAYQVIPVYDPEVLLQIHNANIAHIDSLTDDDFSATLTESWRITERLYDNADAGALHFSPMVASNRFSDALASDKFIDMPMQDPDPSNIAVATRLMLGVGNRTVFTDTSTGKDHYKLDSFGTEILLNAHTLSAKTDGTFKSDKCEFVVASPYVTGDLLHFEMRPMTIYVKNETTPTGDAIWHVSGFYGDVVNYAALDKDSLQNINEAAALSLYGIA